MWRCPCGYVNVGVARCELCNGPAPVESAGPDAALGLPARETPSTAPLHAPPALVVLVIALIGANYAYQHGLVAFLHDRSRDTAVLVALLCGLLFYLAMWVIASTVGHGVRIAPRFDPSARRALLAGVAVGGTAGAFGVAVAVSAQGHAALDPTAALLIDDGRWSALLVGVIVIVGAAPLVEEYVFRGLLAQSFADHNRAAAVWVSAIAFAAMHLSPVRFPYYLAMGAILGGLYLRRGLLASTTAHLVFNGIVLATAAIVLTAGGSSTVRAAGLRLTLPGGWHAVGAPAGDDFAAAGPNGAVLEVLHFDTPATAPVDIDATLRGMQAGATVGPVTIEGFTARTRATGAGLAVQAQLDTAGETGSIAVLPASGTIRLLIMHAPGTTDITSTFDEILTTSRLAP